MTRKLIAYITAVATTYLLATLLVSQFNIARVTEMGFAVDLSERVGAAMHDIAGMLQTYLPLIAIALLIAYLVTGLALLRFFNKPAILYPLAGFVAVIAIHLIMGAVLGLTGVAPTRSIVGLISQGFAGLLGGWVYYRMSRARPA